MASSATSVSRQWMRVMKKSAPVAVKRVLAAVHDRRAAEHAHRLQVVGGARHEVAGRVLLEVGRGLPLEAREVEVAEVVLDVAAHRHQEHPLRVAEDPLEGRDEEQQAGVAEEGLARDLDAQGVHRAADEERRHQPERRRGEDRERGRRRASGGSGGRTGGGRRGAGRAGRPSGRRGYHPVLSSAPRRGRPRRPPDGEAPRARRASPPAAGSAAPRRRTSPRSWCAGPRARRRGGAKLRPGTPARIAATRSPYSRKSVAKARVPPGARSPSTRSTVAGSKRRRFWCRSLGQGSGK